MKIVKRYVKDHRKLLFALCMLFAVAALVFYLYSLPLEAVLYTAAVSLVLALIFFILPDFLAYLRRYRILEEWKENLLTAWEVPSFEGTLSEEQLVELCSELCRKLREVETQWDTKQNDMLEYYTLWVHQIKTPLAAMRLILQSHPVETGEVLKQELFKVERYVEMGLGYLRLETMSSDLRLELLPVREVVKHAVKKFAPLFIYQKLSLDLKEFENRVITDEKWLLFVLEQLLSNALKYTKQGGVTIWMDQDDVLYLRDTGAGISPEDLPRVFERGFTGYNGRREKTSTGLGLYLSKVILDKLQNRIEIDSEPGNGTEVRLYLHRPKLGRE